MATADLHAAFALTELLGVRVRSAHGELLGKLVDLTVDLGQEHPSVERLAVGRARRARWFTNWADVVSLELRELRLGPGALQSSELDPRELRLVHDVLDTQVVDVAGKRLARVSEVLLGRAGTAVRVVAVDVGVAGVWRRLGLGWLARLARPQVVDWSDLHPASARGHALALATPGVGVHRLNPAELATLVAHLPIGRGAEVLHAVTPPTAAEALSLSHPHVGAELLNVLPGPTAAAIAELLPAPAEASPPSTVSRPPRPRGRQFARVRRPRR